VKSVKSVVNISIRNFFVFQILEESGLLLLESFDIRQNMVWWWQEDGGSLLPTRFVPTAKQGTQCQNFQEVFLRPDGSKRRKRRAIPVFVKNEGLRSVVEAGPEFMCY